MKKKHFLLILFLSLLATTQAQWQMLHTGFEHNFFDVECIDQNTVFLAGGEILKTTDGGKTWTKKYAYNGTTSVNYIEFADSNTGYAGYKGMLKTTDGGENWFELDISGALQGIYLVDADTLFVCSSTKLFKSTNGGQSWTEKFSLPEPTYGNKITDAFFIDNVGYLASEHYIFKSVDYGETWEIKVTSSDFVNYSEGSKLHFQDKDNGKAFYGSNGLFLETTDGFESYEIIQNEIFYYKEMIYRPAHYQIKFLSPQYGCAVGYEPLSQWTGIYVTNDGGNLWQIAMAFDKYDFLGEPIPHHMWAVDGTGESTFFVGTVKNVLSDMMPAGFIYTNSTTVGIEEQFDIKDIQPYPNPVRNILNINTTLSIEQFIIYDLLGREQLRIEDELPTPYSIDVSKLQAGIYLLKTQSATNTSIQKFIKQ